MKVYLASESIHYGDGLGNCMRAQRQIFQDLGYSCEIYTVEYDERSKDERQDLAGLKCKAEDLLVYHCTGHVSVELLECQPCKKVMVYHNITPPEFFEGPIREWCQWGLDQISTLRGVFDAVVGVSQFNVDCLRKLGMIDWGEGEVLPIPVELSGKRREWKQRPNRDCLNFLFVGRYMPNKKLEDIMDIFAYYHDYIDSEARLKLVGNPDAAPEYSERIRQKWESLDCWESIELAGKVTNARLQQYYAEADIFLCASEHEGFCIPLLEAMWHRLPVFAYDAGAVRETMGDAGVVYTEKNPAAVAQLIATVMEDKKLLKTIIRRQDRRVSDFSVEKVKERLEELLPRWLGKTEAQREKEPRSDSEKKLKIQMQGSFEISYSLAQVNRFLIEAMYKADLADVSIHCTDGLRDYDPSEENMRDKPLAKYLWKREKFFGTPDVSIRNTYPPTTTGLTAQLNFQSFGWEEDRVPQKHVKDFNRDLDGIGTTSDFVTQALKDSGLTIPVKTMGNGVRLPDNYKDLKPYPLKTRKKIKFLHISSAFPRKGVDVLMETYFDAFTDQDDVCLVLKTFPNIHNTTVEQLAKLRKKYPNGPEVEHIDMDLSEELLYGLYKTASCYIHCARGEGFGLPVAEAMLARIPVIVCNNTGLADFCREDTCLTVGYTMEKAHSHLSENSRWAEPDRKQLKQRLVDFVFHPAGCGVEKKVENAYQLISTKFTWEAVARRWMDFIHEVKTRKEHPAVDMVTTWNNKCGIAEFARYYVEASNQLVDYRIFPDTGHTLVRQDEKFVQKRAWYQGLFQPDDIEELLFQLRKSPSKILHIQYNSGFFSPYVLAKLCVELKDEKHVIIEFHSTGYVKEQLKPQEEKYTIRGLNSAYRIVVHQQADVDELMKLGVNRSVIAIIPLGQVTFAPRPIEQARCIMGITSNHVVGSYGFLLPHKGIEKTIQAVALLKEKYPDIKYIASCALYDADTSRDYYQKCIETVRRLQLENNVFLFTNFLKPEESIVLLQACDVLVMPYDNTRESASGAVRFCVAAKRPLITTRQNIFWEFEDCSFQFRNNTPEEIAKAIERMMDPATAQEYVKRMEQRIEETSWHTVVRQYLDLYRQ